MVKQEYRFNDENSRHDMNKVDFEALMSKAVLTEINVADIKQHPKNPRVGIEYNLQPLVDSFLESGQLEPIKVKIDKDGYTVLQGNRRVLAWKKAIETKPDFKPLIKAYLFDSLTEDEEEALLFDHGFQKPLNSYAELFKMFSEMYENGYSLPSIAEKIWPAYCNVVHVPDEKYNIIMNSDNIRQAKANYMKGKLQQFQAGYDLPVKLNNGLKKKENITVEYPFRSWYIDDLRGKKREGFTFEEMKRWVNDASKMPSFEEKKAFWDKIAAEYDKPAIRKGGAGKEKKDDRLSVAALEKKMEKYRNDCPSIVEVFKVAAGGKGELTEVVSDLSIVDFLKESDKWDLIKLYYTNKKSLGIHPNTDVDLIITGIK